MLEVEWNVNPKNRIEKIQVSQEIESSDTPNEEYPNLPHAPIVEAVIHWSAHPGKQLEPNDLQEELSKTFPEYPICQPQQEIEFSSTGEPSGLSVVVQQNGFRLEGEGKPFVVQFTSSGVVFSRLAPYDNWESFETEGMRFWDLFVKLGEPSLIDRLGVRFINQIQIGEGEKASDFLLGGPSPVDGMELSAGSFYYQDTFRVPDLPYHVKWARTIQPRQPSQLNEKTLIVDIDVCSDNLPSMERRFLKERLAKMRQIKNEVFFNCMTDHALKQFGA